MIFSKLLSVVNHSAHRFLAFAFLLTFSFSLYAQGLDIDVDIGKPEWYENPLVWVIAGLAIILIVVLAKRR